jgi:hypothetical protein
VGFGVGVVTQGHEIEYRLVDFAKSDGESNGDDNSRGDEGVSSQLSSECRTLHGHTVKIYQDNMTVVGVFHKISSKCPQLMSEIKELVPCLLENKIHLDVVCIHSETCGPCNNPHTTRALAYTWSRRPWVRRSTQTRLFEGVTTGIKEITFEGQSL